MTEAEVLGSALMDLYCPFWHACVLGPADEDGERVVVKLDYIMKRTEHEARNQVWKHLHDVCSHLDMPLRVDDWTIKHLLIVNGN